MSLLKGRLVVLVLLAAMLVAGLLSVSGAPPAAAAAGDPAIKVEVDNKLLTFDVSPFIEKGRVLVPVRALCEALGASVAWDGKTRTVTVKKGDTVVKLTIGSKIISITERGVTQHILEVPAKIVNGRAMVPLRLLSEFLGAKVDWDAGNHTVAVATRITITDSLGRTVEVPYRPSRVVVLTTDAAEVMRILEIRIAVVGVGDTVQKESHLGFQDKPIVGKWNNPSIEKIVELKPQVVITYGQWPGPELEQKLEPAGIKVVRLDFYKPETFDSDMRALAQMFGREKVAEDFLRWKEQKIALLSDRLKGLADEDKLRVFAISASKLEQATWSTFGQGTATHQGIEMAGGINVAAALKEYPQVSAEWILQQNPDVLVIPVYDERLGYTATDFTEAAALQKKALENQVLGKTKAAKDQRVYLLRNFLLGGNKTYLGALFLAKWFYPERFQDIKPEQILNEYFEKWLEVPFKGKWAYPESDS